MKRISAFIAAAALVLTATGLEAASITLAWDPNPEPDIAGYTVCYGVQPGVYTNSINVGNQTSFVVPDLTAGQRYYFMVQAYNNGGLTSAPSQEVSGIPETPRTSLPGKTTTADFDGDGAMDLAVWRPGNGTWYIARSSDNYGDSTARQVQWGSGAMGDIPVPGDYDGDGRTDPAIWRPGDGTWYILKSSSNYTAVQQVQWGSDSFGDIPVPADYDGDGRTDLAIWRPASGTWHILRSSDNFSYSTSQHVQWGAASLNDVPVPGDYDGDGRTDLAIWRPGDGTWYILKSSVNYSYANYQQVQWGSGAMSDVPVPGDYDGDGRTDLAVWRPGDGTWYILKSSANYTTSRQVQWGAAAQGDRPVPGDYDGDGRTDLAVWRPGNGTWYILKSTSDYSYAGCQQAQWGIGALQDVPLFER
jgi:hypothetical protein